MGGGEILSVIVADGLTHRFGSEVALEGLDLVLDSGEHMAVLGENGAGKTTLLRVLATALRPTAGRLRIAGLDAFQERRRLRHYLGYVAHAPGLYPALSAAENLEFFCDLQGVSRSRAAEVLETVGLKAVAHRRADQLSRGTQQRLAIGRAILHEPRLLILDEPDASLGAGAFDLLSGVMHGTTVVLATHDQALANRLCPRPSCFVTGAPWARRHTFGSCSEPAPGRACGRAQRPQVGVANPRAGAGPCPVHHPRAAHRQLRFSDRLPQRVHDCPRNPVAGPGLCGAGRIRPHICRRTRAGVAGGDAHDAGVASRDLRRQGARGRGAARRLRDGSPARTEPVLR